MKFLTIKKGFYLIPAFDCDLDVFKKIAVGETIECEYKSKRRYKNLQKFFVLLKIGFDNQDKEQNIELYRARVLIGIGYCDIIYLEDGKINFIPKSISYDNMPNENDFLTIYNKAVEFIARQLDINNEDLALEILSNF